MFEKILKKKRQVDSGKKSAKYAAACIEQDKQLRKLLKKARKTAFGKHYEFRHILKSPDPVDLFQQIVPPATYDDFYNQWWRISRSDETDITWPGIVPYYALSSGTSGASSKYIPVTKDMLKAMNKGSRRMFFDLRKYQLPPKQFRRRMLMVGSCTAPTLEKQHFVGDLSGIMGQNRPGWLSRYYRPGRKITDLPDWHQRIDAIVKDASKWDIGFVVGNPAWVRMIFEQMVERYGVTHIHEIWKNFRVYVHGGVFFEPYRAGFEKLLGEEVHYIDSYLASEGFFAYEKRPGSRALTLLTDCGVFFEFIPFKAPHFDWEGNMHKNAQAVTLSEVSEGEEYALLISTCSGAWRYLLGDTIRFTDLNNLEFRITGRTRQFLSTCGEHLSVDNLNMAVRKVNETLDAGILEFAVAGVPHGSFWAHQWYVSLENDSIDPKILAEALDQKLCELNDDYAVERRYALPEIRLEIVSNQLFYEWLEKRGKMNGQAKIPRVLKGKTLEDWQQFLHAATV